MPNAFQAPVDTRIVSAYMEKQMGMPPPKEKSGRKAERITVAQEVSGEEK